MVAIEELVTIELKKNNLFQNEKVVIEGWSFQRGGRFTNTQYQRRNCTWEFRVELWTPGYAVQCWTTRHNPLSSLPWQMYTFVKNIESMAQNLVHVYSIFLHGLLSNYWTCYSTKIMRFFIFLVQRECSAVASGKISDTVSQHDRWL